MGFDEHFPWKDDIEAINYIIEPTGHTAEELMNTPGGILNKTKPGEILENGFYTYSGKIEIYSTSMESNGYDPLPFHEDPPESPSGSPETAGDFPVILTTGARYPVFVHTQHRNIESLRKFFPEPLMEIHPETAAEYGITDGTLTNIETKRGSLKIKAELTTGILPGVVHISHGWKEADCNLLTDDMKRDPVSGFPALKSMLCRISRA